MKKSFLFGLMLFAAFLLTTASAFATESDNKDYDSYNNCYQLDYGSCLAGSAYCTWDPYRNMCIERGFDGRDDRDDRWDRNCSYIRDPYRCNQDYNCRWDQRYNQCLDRNQGPDNRCERIYDAYRCNQSRDCSWDQWQNRCESRGGNGGWDPTYPPRCSQIYSKRECLSVGGCAWENVRGYCQDMPFGRPY